MRRIVTLFFLTIFTLQLVGQIDYEVTGARKVKMGYNPFPRDFHTEQLGWTGLNSTCIADLQFGNWFDLNLKSDQVKFTVHTGNKMGTLKDPKLYLGVVKEDKRGRVLTEVKCVAHTGSEGTFSIESTGLNPDDQYFVLVAAVSADLAYAIETTDKFDPAPEVVQQKEALAFFQSIFGRITDKAGKGKAGVKVSLLNAESVAVETSTTDKDGIFKFEKLPKDEVFMTRIEEDDTELMVEMFLLDKDGKIKNRSSRIGDQLYAFGADKDSFERLKLLTESDCKVNNPDGRIGVVGKVVDNKTYLFGRPGIKVGLYSDDRSLLASAVTDAKGMFTFLNLENKLYDVKVEVDQVKDYTEVVLVDDLDVPFSSSSSEFLDKEGFFTFKPLPKEIVELKRIQASDTKMKLPSDFSTMDQRQPIVLNNILFASGSAELLESSFSELDELVKALEKRKDTRIEVSGHTDNAGSSATNLILSENRAKAVVDYISKKGINRDRLTYKGLGERNPVASNETEDGRRKNRRVEFVVVD